MQIWYILKMKEYLHLVLNINDMCREIAGLTRLDAKSYLILHKNIVKSDK